MAEIRLNVDIRDEFGKGAARRLRRAHKIPAVLYGHHTDPVHVALPEHETALALRAANVLLTLGLPDGADQLALPKQVQRDPIRDSIEHVDLILVRRGEKVTVEVPLVLVGEAQPETVVNQERSVVSIQAEATNIPAEITLSIDGLDVGAQLTLADVTLPQGSELAEDADGLVVSVA
jgi:large subunit ribosomal protein L25